jgi:hypothetical protein
MKGNDEGLVIILCVAFFVVIVYFLFTNSCYDNKYDDNYNPEKFGALQSLYSNDGIQDAYLTLENDPRYTDPYAYWRGVTWDLPTRNLNRLIYYPYLYEYYIDRYGRLYPYW